MTGHAHPRRAIVELVANAVSKARDRATVKAADGQKTFSDLALEKAVYGTGWDILAATYVHRVSLPDNVIDLASRRPR